jgi:tetratricopeptide (TPR) repeat protein
VLVHECDAHRWLGVPPRAAARDGGRKLVAEGDRRHEQRARGGAASPPATAARAALSRALASVHSGPGSSIADADRCVSDLLAAVPPHDAIVDSTAVERLLAIRDRCPGSALAALECAVAASKAGLDDPAAWGFVRLYERRPDVPEALIAYADHLRRHHHLEAVTGELAKVASDSPLAGEAAWREAIAHTARLDFAAARAGFAHAAEIGAPPDSSWYGFTAAIDQAAKTGGRARAAPGDPIAQIAYGRALGDLGLYDESYRAFHAARLLRPGDPEADAWLGRYLLLQGRPEPALHAFARALEADRDYAPALQGAAEALWAARRPAAAIPFLRRVAERAPRDARARYNLACVLAASGDLTGAETELGEAVKLGYSDVAQIAGDPDLAALRERPAYARALASARAAARDAARQP